MLGAIPGLRHGDYESMNPWVYYIADVFLWVRLFSLLFAVAVGMVTFIVMVNTYAPAEGGFEKPESLWKIKKSLIRLGLLWLIPVCLYTFLPTRKVLLRFYSCHPKVTNQIKASDGAKARGKPMSGAKNER